MGGLLGGAFWGGIVGWLKARTGAHEVIVTIMMNYIAAGLLAYLLTTAAFQRPGRTDPISPIVDWNATMPRLEGGQLHLGFPAGSARCRSGVVAPRPLDHRVRDPRRRRQPARRGNGRDERGPDDHHHHVAGRRAGRAGRRSGGAWVRLLQACRCRCRSGSSARSDSTRSPLHCSGRSKPLGIVLAGLLFGALHAGGLAMQSVAQTPLTLTTVLQALIVLFVAAPALVTKIVPFLKARKNAGAWAGS